MNSSIQFLNILLILCVSLYKQWYTVRERLVLHWWDQSHYEVTNKSIIAYLALIKRPGIALSHNPFCNLQWLAILWLKNELKVLFSYKLSTVQRHLCNTMEKFIWFFTFLTVKELPWGDMLLFTRNAVLILQTSEKWNVELTMELTTYRFWTKLD